MNFHSFLCSAVLWKLSESCHCEPQRRWGYSTVSVLAISSTSFSLLPVSLITLYLHTSSLSTSFGFILPSLLPYLSISLIFLFFLSFFCLNSFNPPSYSPVYFPLSNPNLPNKQANEMVLKLHFPWVFTPNIHFSGISSSITLTEMQFT